MISREEVDTLAGLARLKFTGDEASALQKDISRILDYVGQLQGGVHEAAAPAPQLVNVLRADEPRAESDPLAHKEEALRAAFPTEERGYNVVRKIIQKDE